MEEYINNFMEYLTKEKFYSEKTILSYRLDLNDYSLYLEENNIDFKTINKDEVREFLKYLDNLKLKNSTIGRHMSSVRSFYAFLLHEKTPGRHQKPYPAVLYIKCQRNHLGVHLRKFLRKRCLYANPSPRPARRCTVPAPAVTRHGCTSNICRHNPWFRQKLEEPRFR